MTDAANTIANLLTAVGVLLGGVAVVWPLLRKLDRKVSEVHTIVNQQRTDMQRLLDAYALQLTDAGLVPVRDQSKAAPSDPQ